MNQKEDFLNFGGDDYYNRNKELISAENNENDEIINIIKSIKLKPKCILEIGCANGFRLHLLNKIFNAKCYGLDPSQEAITEGQDKFKNIFLKKGTADMLPFQNEEFDLVIFGFCLYLCDRKDLFKIVYEADKALKDGGCIAIKDFYPPFAYKNKYKYNQNIYSYKMDYSKLFTCNPAYTLISQTVFTHNGFKDRNLPDERLAITILQKNIINAYPEEPFKKNAEPAA